VPPWQHFLTWPYCFAHEVSPSEDTRARANNNRGFAIFLSFTSQNQSSSAQNGSGDDVLARALPISKRPLLLCRPITVVPRL
jgi:hypothetical protein